jgi:hypothetical protein
VLQTPRRLLSCMVYLLIRLLPFQKEDSDQRSPSADRGVCV